MKPFFLIVLAIWRIVVPIVFARKAHKKGYNYYCFGALGMLISPLLCIVLTLALPDKVEQARLESRISELEKSLDKHE